MKPFPRLYAVADASFGDPVRLAAMLFKGGVQLLQVRNKRGGAGEFLHQVERILELSPANAAVIVNDRADITLISGAHGLHLGQTDLPPLQARQILRSNQMIGFSTHSLTQARDADRLPVDYIAVGPIFPTATKPNADPAVGLERLAEICAAVEKPVVAIGGITLESAEDVLAAGARSIAAIRDILESPDIVCRVQSWIDLLNRI
jgi:thiamine-phosphate pyrophosphorylase